MNHRRLVELGVPAGEPMEAVRRVLAAHRPDAATARAEITRILRAPEDHVDDPTWGAFAAAVVAARADVTRFVPRQRLAPARYWGKAGEDFDQASVDQLRNACSLPVAAAAALMPDAHVGYGLPIGGVLATENAVVPYAVGVDIACRMRMTVLDMPASLLDHGHGRDRLTKAIEAETRFGIGAAFQKRREHEVMDADWSVSPITSRNKDKAWSQLGTSGSGNHFVEFGTLTIDDPAHAAALGLEPGVHLALLSHSGSRGTGAAVCDHYSKIAMAQHPELPKELKHLAWLDLDSEAGAEYFAAMELMGEYAAANHACVHRHIVKNLGARALASIENHHNFAWKEVHDPGDGGGVRELIVHRKGATPAGDGVLGIIPGSMATPGYVVRGRGGAGSLDSASHGAGRVMSRTQAKNTFRWNAVRELLAERGVTVISAGIDENPLVYKDIATVMARQTDLVEPLARFDPRLVKMAPEGERAED
ncbi:MAG: RtcB family protein [Phycisphaerales bacterium]